MSIKMKALIETLKVLVAGFLFGLIFLGLGNLFGEKVAALVFLSCLVGFMMWILYNHNVNKLTWEEKYGKDDKSM